MCQQFRDKLLKLHDNNGGPYDNGDDEGAGAKEYADDDNADDNDDTLRTVVISWHYWCSCSAVT